MRGGLNVARVASARAQGRPTGRSSRVLASSAALIASPFSGVNWSIAYIAFLVYTVSITTQRGPFGTAAMIAAMIGLAFEPKAFRLPRPLLLLILLAVWSAIGILYTDYPDRVSTSAQEFAKIAAVCVVMVNVVNTRQRLRCLLVIQAIAFIIYPLRGTLTYYFVIHETAGGRAIWNHMYNNSNDLAGFLLLQLAMALAMLEIEKGWTRVMTVGTAIMYPCVILLTQSRGALIATVAFLVIAGRKYARQPKRLIIAAIIISASLPFVPNSVWKRLTTYEDEVDTSTGAYLQRTEAAASADQRKEIWKVATRVITDNPLGVGIGAYPLAHFAAFSQGGFDALGGGKRDTHSTYLKLAAERGFVGLGLFLWLLASVCRTSMKVRKKYGPRAPALARQLFWFEAGLYGYFIAAIWGSYDQWVPTYFQLMLVCCAAKLIEDDFERPVMRRGNAIQPLRVGAPLRAAGAL
jgi:hypothetical protein